MMTAFCLLAVDSLSGEEVRKVYHLVSSFHSVHIPRKCHLCHCVCVLDQCMMNQQHIDVLISCCFLLSTEQCLTVEPNCQERPDGINGQTHSDIPSRLSLASSNRPLVDLKSLKQSKQRRTAWDLKLAIAGDRLSWVKCVCVCVRAEMMMVMEKKRR